MSRPSSPVVPQTTPVKTLAAGPPGPRRGRGRPSACRLAWPAPGPAVLLALGACAEPARFTVAEGSGNNPALPAPSRALIPTVNIAPARGWPPGAMPTPAPGPPGQALSRDLG